MSVCPFVCQRTVFYCYLGISDLSRFIVFLNVPNYVGTYLFVGFTLDIPKCRYLTFLFYFSFPSNPFTCAEWISIVARERRDDFYKPATNSVICSDHFDKLDISGNTNRRRLVKTAVPKLQVRYIH